jgi:NAD(P)-dependent dehydrogenase (short-subunit alcohol dehydrogenase family)
VYDCAPDTARERAGVEEARTRIQKHAFKKYEPGPLHFHDLDLESVESARASAEALKEKLERLDILVANAATVSSSDQLSPDGYDKTFAVNCLGHFVFVNGLVGTCCFLCLE